MTDDAQCGSMPCSSGLSQRMLAAQACDQQGQVGSSLGDGQAAACSAELDGDIVSSNSAVAAVAQARSFVPAATASYLQPDYWDARFGEEDAYEWCKVRSAARHLMQEVTPIHCVCSCACFLHSLTIQLHTAGLQRVPAPGGARAGGERQGAGAGLREQRAGGGAGGGRPEARDVHRPVGRRGAAHAAQGHRLRLRRALSGQHSECCTCSAASMRCHTVWWLLAP